ncbi:MAG: cytochrome c class I [Pseudopedobacter saltans]|uniref:Cytochrome c class I n=1 Tax=Pseudopedobacter saltans TaxID=151895 RepID=A0A2W5F5V3_9SPHI|nr:MAG: cytochrome c class I [Pseudopedobacter saltans]
MKKNILFAMAIVLSLAAITSSSCHSPSKDKTETSTTSSGDDLTQNPDYQKGFELVQRNDCLTCHTVSTTATGPSFSDIAKKYTDADVAHLADKVIKGGSGSWGQSPMTPHPTLSKADAEQMVKYILLLKNQGE